MTLKPKLSFTSCERGLTPCGDEISGVRCLWIVSWNRSSLSASSILSWAIPSLCMVN